MTYRGDNKGSVLENDELVVCVSCGMTSYLRGGETEKWKAIQLGSTEDGMTWYCSKDICREKFNELVAEKTRELRVAQGLPPDPPPPVERPEHPMKENEGGIVLGVPPGGFDAVERRDAPTPGSPEDRAAEKPQDTIRGSKQGGKTGG